MLVAGIDVGSLTTKAIVLDDGKVLAKRLIVSTEEAEDQGRRALEEALEETDFSLTDLKAIVATGVGRKFVTFAHNQKTPLSCLSKGINLLLPQVRTLFDIGAETSTVIRLNERGGVEDSVGHDRCASGTGTFLVAMAKVLQMPLEEMAKRSLLAESRAEISNMCAIFAEQEVISHIHRDPPSPTNDIIAGIHASMAVRLVGLSKRIEIEPEVALSGGVAKNVGFVKIFEEALGRRVLIPEEPQFVGALGAARIAQE